MKGQESTTTHSKKEEGEGRQVELNERTRWLQSAWKEHYPTAGVSVILLD